MSVRGPPAPHHRVFGAPDRAADQGREARDQDGDEPDDTDGHPADDYSAPAKVFPLPGGEPLPPCEDRATGLATAVPVWGETAGRAPRAELPQAARIDGHDRGLRAEPDIAASPRGQPRVQAEHPACTEAHHDQPGEHEHDVGAVVVGRGVPADRQEESQRQQDTPDGGDPGPQADHSADPDRKFAEGDQQTHQGRCVGRQSEQKPDRATLPEQQHLVGHRARIARVEVAGIGQLLQSGVGEGDPEEQPQGQNQPPWLALPTRRQLPPGR